MSKTRELNKRIKDILLEHILVNLVRHQILNKKEAKRVIIQQTCSKDKIRTAVEKADKEKKQDNASAVWKPDKDKQYYLNQLAKINGWHSITEAASLIRETRCVRVVEPLFNAQLIDNMPLLFHIISANPKIIGIPQDLITFAFDHLVESTDVNQLGPDNVTLLMTAYAFTQDFNHHYVQALLKKRPNMDAQGGKYKQTILHHAVELNDIQAIRTFVAAGANTEVKDGNNATPYACAVVNGRLDVADTFLELKANKDPTIGFVGARLINLCFQTSNEQVRQSTLKKVEFLIARNVSLYHPDWKQDYVLHAVVSGRNDILKILLSHGACVNRRVRGDHPDVRKMLKMFPKNHLTTFEFACMFLNYEAVVLLVETGKIDIDQVYYAKLDGNQYQEVSIFYIFNIDDQLSPEQNAAKEKIKEYLQSKSAKLAAIKIDENNFVFIKRIMTALKKLEATPNKQNSQVLAKSEEVETKQEERNELEDALVDFNDLRTEGRRLYGHLPSRFNYADDALRAKGTEAIKNLAVELADCIRRGELRQMVDTPKDSDGAPDHKDPGKGVKAESKDEPTYKGIPLSQLDCVYTLRGEPNHRVWFDPKQIKNLDLDDKEVKALQDKLTELRLVSPEKQQGIVSTGDKPPVCELVINGQPVANDGITAKIKLFAIDGQKNERRILLVALKPDKPMSHAPTLLLAVDVNDNHRSLADKYVVTLTLSPKVAPKDAPKLRVAVPGTLYVPGKVSPVPGALDSTRPSPP